MKMNKDAYYFPHFSNARHDRKIKRIVINHGLKAYAVYFMLLEVIRDEDGFCYPKDDLDLLANEFQVEKGLLESIINDYGLFLTDENGNFFSEKFNEFMKPYLDKKKRAREAANIRWEKERNANALHEKSTGNTSKVKESKEKKIKENKSVTLDSESNELNSDKGKENPLYSKKLIDIKIEEVETNKDSTIQDKISDMAWRMHRELGKDYKEYPYYEKATLKKWRDPIRLLKEQDGIPLLDIWNYFTFCRQHEKFWKGIIQSPSGLRSNINRIMSDYDNRKDSTTKILTHAEMLDLMDDPSHPSKSTDDFRVIKENGKTRFRYGG